MEKRITVGQAKELLQEYLTVLRSLGYKESTIKVTRNSISYYLSSLSENSCFTESSIQDFVARYDHTSQKSRFNFVLNSCLRFCNYAYQGQTHFNRRTICPNYQLLEIWEDMLERFLSSLSNANNHETIARKRKCLSIFLEVHQTNLSQVNTDTGKNILKYVAGIPPENKAYIRSFLHFLFIEGKIPIDYSALIYVTSRNKKIPSIYTDDEIQAVLSTFSEDSTVGIRNKVIFLLASTTGMRSCDLVALTPDNFDFEKNAVIFTQKKTGVPLSICITDEVVRLVKSYQEVRPNVTCKELFVNQNAPHSPISTGSLRYILNKAFRDAKVSTEGRRHGPHAIRASLASAMINADVPYETVQHMLGHTSSDSLQSYVRFDVKNLRRCALPTYPASGMFKEWLEVCQ